MFVIYADLYEQVQIGNIYYNLNWNILHLSIEGEDNQ